MCIHYKFTYSIKWYSTLCIVYIPTTARAWGCISSPAIIPTINRTRITSKMHLALPFTNYYVLCKCPDSSLLLLLLANLIPLAKAWWMKLYPEAIHCPLLSNHAFNSGYHKQRLRRKHSRYSSPMHWKQSATALISLSRPLISGHLGILKLLQNCVLLIYKYDMKTATQSADYGCSLGSQPTIFPVYCLSTSQWHPTRNMRVKQGKCGCPLHHHPLTWVWHPQYTPLPHLLHGRRLQFRTKRKQAAITTLLNKNKWLLELA